MRPAAFLDRDGVLLHLRRNADGSKRGARSLSEVELVDGVVPAVRTLADSGYVCIVVTNQPDIASGTQTLARMSAVHRYLRSRLALTDIYVCCHDRNAGCACRKPSPGMLSAAVSDHGLDMSRSVMFGDRLSDRLAARAAGCGFYWITADAQDDGVQDHTAPAARVLSEAVADLVAHSRYPYCQRKEPADVVRRYLDPGRQW